MLIAQIEGLNKAVDAAAGKSWEAVTVVVVLGAFILAIGFIAKWFIGSFDRQLAASFTREERLAARITELENFIRDTLMGMIKNTETALNGTKQAIDRLVQTLEDKPCLMSEERRSVLVDHIVTGIKEHK